MAVKCKKHPKYKAKQKPRVDCLGCWEAYYWDHDGADYSAKDMSSIMYAIECDRDDRNTAMQDLVTKLQDEVRKL
jgi:hypothetical protein